MDYTIFYKTNFEKGEISNAIHYDFFFSGFDDCERTKIIFDKVVSTKKFWIKFPHYTIKSKIEDVYSNDSYQEDEFFIDLIKQINQDLHASSRICIDITGFIRPHLIFFINLLHRNGIKKLDFLYTEPQHYSHFEDTTFSGFIDQVKIIEGCGSDNNLPDTENDLLIITAGYDDKLIAKIAQNKSKIKKKYYIIGFPSLQPDMYQENILKIIQAKESIGIRIDKYAPAFDPFVTAEVINKIIEDNPNHGNIYLSPLSTKPQTLGIALYYLWNYKEKPINIIFPYSYKYFTKRASGIKKTWRYTFELP